MPKPFSVAAQAEHNAKLVIERHPLAPIELFWKVEWAPFYDHLNEARFQTALFVNQALGCYAGQLDLLDLLCKRQRGITNHLRAACEILRRRE